MVIEWSLILRLVIAGLLGGLVGLERELRAKEAGIRLSAYTTALPRFLTSLDAPELSVE